MNFQCIFIAFLGLVLCARSLLLPLQEEAACTVRTPKQLKSARFWIDDAQRTLSEKLKQIQNRNRAKNVILFLGDGMGVSTVTASRIHDGQMRGILGERNQLSFEKFPYVGLSKTYCVDKQVSDSACTATAYLTGVKANYMTIGVTANVTLSDCQAARYPANQLHSIAGWAIEAGKAAGIVTNTRVTHASPAGNYAHTSHRNFESDYDVERMAGDPSQCHDIAAQLIENDVARHFKVILGGGLAKFLPNTTSDDEGHFGERRDRRNLVCEWLHSKDGNAKFVHNRGTLMNLNVPATDFLLGLFSYGHMDYNNARDPKVQPSLTEMTETAIKMLAKDADGFFLFVEGGRIDHAHHATNARQALDETVEFSNAIQRALELTDPNETLIVVTADHGHTLTINGYPDIDNSVTGLSTDVSDIDGLPYSTLSYANGPAFSKFYFAPKEDEVRRRDLRKFSKFGSDDFQYPAGVPLEDETHGGADVAIYASGPWSHLFTGVVEQNSLPSLMGFAACIGPGLLSCAFQEAY